jgi:hypothetical protein
MQSPEKTPALIHEFTVVLQSWTYYDHPSKQHVTAPAETITGTLRFDLDALAYLLANRARRSASHRATLADNRIHCHITRIQPHLFPDPPPGAGLHATDRQLLQGRLVDEDPPALPPREPE